jgi:hydroxyethylthiazole kinase
VSDDPVIASATAMAAFGIAGERAAAGARGPYTFKVSLFDELARLAPEDLASCAKIRVE